MTQDSVQDIKKQGRPTDYNVEIVAAAQAYLDTLPEDEVVHTIEGLAIAIGVTRETVYEWEKHDDKAAFSYIVKQVRIRQAKALVNNGLNGKFSAKIVGIMLSKHGYREGHDMTTNGKDLPVPIFGNVSTNIGDEEGSPAQ